MKKLLSFISAAVLSSCAVANSLLSASAVNFTLTITNQAQGGMVGTNVNAAQDGVGETNTGNGREFIVSDVIWGNPQIGCEFKLNDDGAGHDTVSLSVNLLDPHSNEVITENVKLFFLVTREDGSQFSDESFDWGPLTLSASDPGPKLGHLSTVFGTISKVRAILTSPSQTTDLSFNVSALQIT
jgi:hypothetical protein